MPRQLWFPCVTLLSLWTGVAARAADDVTVLKTEPNGVPPRRMVAEFHTQQTKAAFDARRQTIAGIQTAEALKKRQDELRQKFIQALGGFPEKTPLNAQVVGTSKQDGFRVERVIYESRPNHHVTANLYLPEGKGPFAAVLVPCGHTTNGKIGYQRHCILLAKNGIAAMSFDPIGQGERYQLLEPAGKPFTNSTNEHTLVGVGAMLIGQCTASYRVWDGIRSIDYLCSRPEIDAKKIGVTGSSGGGTMTSYLMALDDRVAAAAPSCYITSLERLFATLGPQDGEQNIPGQVAFGMEHADYVTMRAPRPTLILAATQDFFDIQGTWTSFREAKQLYGVAGFGERVDLFEYNTKHAYPKQQREAMLRFMRRWLLGIDEPVTEGELPTLKDEELRCTRTGQVLEDLKGRSAFDFTAERDRQLAGQRAKFFADNKPEDVVKEVRRLVGLPASIKAGLSKDQGGGLLGTTVLDKLVLQTEAGISVPALSLMPMKLTGAEPVVIVVHEQGKAADSALLQELAKAGNRVVSLDLRGLGETAPAPLPARATFFGHDYRESFIGIHLNRPLLGQRLYDLLAVIEAVAQHTATAKAEIRLIGVGLCGPIALHAAALDNRIKHVTIDRGLVSWSSVARTLTTYGQLTNVVPGALQVYDLPDLAGLIAPRTLVVKNAVDAQQKPLKQASLEEAYAACKEAYARQNAEKQLTLQGE
jgi:cephalosporin-C deacetylase-like acetyl esterase